MGNSSPSKRKNQMAVQAEDISAAPDAAAPAPAPAPTSATPPTEEPAPSAATDDSVEDLPEELLREVPALQLLMNGSPPATFASRDAQFPELDVVAKHLKDLGKAGFGLYESRDGANIVMFNGLYVTPDELKAADEAGQLASVAVPYEELRSAFDQPSAPAGEPGAAPAPAAPPVASGGPAPQKSVTTARAKNISAGSPTSGPVPGQGRILNNILKPVV